MNNILYLYNYEQKRDSMTPEREVLSTEQRNKCKRGELWDKLVGYNTPSEAGIIIELNNSMYIPFGFGDDTRKGRLSEASEFIPELDDRIGKIASDLTMQQYLKNNKEEIGSGNVYRLITESNKWTKTTKGKKFFEGKTKEVSDKIDHNLTVERLRKEWATK